MMSVQKSKFGKGLFATVDIPKNTIVTRVTGRPMDFAATVALGDRESHTFQTGPNQYILCDSPFLYSNHSCDPNCGITPDLELITLQEIKKGEELFWDYSTSMLERHWTMRCNCGAAECRGLVEDFDLLPQELQDKYTELNIVLPFIIKKLRLPGVLTYSTKQKT